MDERREAPVADVDAGARGDGDGDGVVEENELLVGVPGGDGEVKAGVEARGGAGGGEVKGGEFEAGDGEGGAVGAVEEPDDATGDGGEEDEGEEEDGEPDAAEAAATAASAGGLEGGWVELAGGVGKVGFCGGWAVEGLGRGVGGGGFSRWMDSLCHFPFLSLSFFTFLFWIRGVLD